MQGHFVSLLSISALICFSSSAMRCVAAETYAAPASDSGLAMSGYPAVTADWPLTFNSGGKTYSIFEPQCDSWNGHDFIGRSAVAVQVQGQPQPIYGTIDLAATTLVDKNAGTVKLADMKIKSADFPADRAQAKTFLAALRVLPQRVPTLSLERVQGSLTLPPIAHTQRLNNAPPTIITDTSPAMLVSIDGPAVWRPVSGTSLERAINTRVLLLRDASGRCYLHLFDGYLQANSLEDKNWRLAKKIPDGAALAQEQALAAGNVDLMRGNPDPTTGREPSIYTSTIPDVFVTTTPTELINFSGAPQYVPVPGTDLLYAENTSADVFKLLTDQHNYVLLSGRWYRAPSLNGPWQFVPGNDLPHDFANIPDNSPKENVKASVPGTEQAQDALVANSIPQSAAVPLNQKMENAQIDGPPQLAPIEGTPLHYVANSETPIIEVNPQSWYACQDGVWYFSASVNGPWSVATHVPPVIYTIPPSSPLHYLTYVQVYDSDQNDAYDGYTPGYMGTEVGDDGTVVYGSGYSYQPWIGSVWFSAPVTWGFGFAPCWTPWCGWGFNCGFGWGCRFPGFAWRCGPPFPCFAGFRGFHSFGHHGFIGVNHFAFAHTGVNVFHKGSFVGNRFGSQFAANRFGVVRFNSGFARTFNSRSGQFFAVNGVRVQGTRGSAFVFRSGQFAFRTSVSRPMMGSPVRPMNMSTFRPMNPISPAFRSVNPAFRPVSPAFRSFNPVPMARPMSPAPGVTFQGNSGFRSMPSPGWNGGGTRSGGGFQGNGGGVWIHSGGSFQGGGGGGGFHSGGWGGGGGGFHGGGGGGGMMGGGGHGR